MLLVGSFEPFDGAEARRVGADDVLTKPFQSIRQLVNRVGTLLGGAPPEAEATTRKLSTLGLESTPEVDPESDARTPQVSEHSAAGNETDATDLMSTAEIELTTADTRPLDDAELETTAFAGDDLMPNPTSAPVVDMAEPFAAGARNADDEQTAWAERVSSDTSATADYESETSLRIEHGEHTMEQPQAAAGADQFDDVVLDLGDLDAPPAEAVYADAILDLEDEVIATHEPGQSQRATSVPVIETAPPSISVQDYESEFESGWSDSSTLTPAEKYSALEQESGAREHSEVAAWEIVPSLVTVDEKLDEAAVWPPSESAIESRSEDATEPAAQAEATPSESGGGERLSAALIDAIARRVVEQMSDKVVREIAWEVVPELAELLIKRHLEEQK
jgi:CheY-like chemotaxis protein